MAHRIPKTVAVVATAATAAVAAYAVGSETNSGGTAAAGAAQPSASGPAPAGAPRYRDRGRRGGGPDGTAFLSDLAAKLGVKPAALQDALQSLLPQRGFGDPGTLRDDAAKALADALKVDQAKVTAALDKLADDRLKDGRPGRFDPSSFAAALAKELGVDPADVTAALEKLRTDHQAQERKDRDTFAQKLADKLGISVEKVKSVLQDGPFGRHGGPGGPGGPRGPGVFGPRWHS